VRAANATLQAFLASRQSFWVADLFLFELANGTTYAWTSYTGNLTVGGHTYSALGPLIDRTKWGIKNTIDVPEMEIQIYSNGTDLPDGSNLKLQVHNGLFDYAQITLSRVFMPTPGDCSLGAVEIFTGNTAELEINALGIKLTVKGANNTLAQYMPRQMYSNTCNHTLFDSGCAPNPGQPDGGPLRSTYTSTNTVGASPTRYAIAWGGTVPANPANFRYGYITFTSGVASGQTRTLGVCSDTSIAFVYPLYEAPAEGDTFEITYGCSRTRNANGCPFFNNLTHFLGFPWVPPETYGT